MLEYANIYCSAKNKFAILNKKKTLNVIASPFTNHQIKFHLFSNQQQKPIFLNLIFNLLRFWCIFAVFTPHVLAQQDRCFSFSQHNKVARKRHLSSRAPPRARFCHHPRRLRLAMVQLTRSVAVV